MKIIKYLFERERKPRKGLAWFEWAMLVYLVLTTLVALFMQQQLVDPEAIYSWRIQAVALTAGVWLVYRIWPCRMTMMLRASLQVVMLGTWYPDVYEFNRSLSSLDHVFATWEQQLFGCQPALLFSQRWPSAVVSELMTLGYASYYPMIGAVVLWYLFSRYDRFERTTFIIVGAFFIYYLFFMFVPVVGPQYYYPAVGLDQIAAGHFPDLGHYFRDHTECLDIPGWSSGLFHHLVQVAHDAGERPTAAFPSSHVGVSTILLFLAWPQVSRVKGTAWYHRLFAHRLFWCLLPLYVLLCLSTVYIYAHYAVDVIGGLFSAVLIYVALWLVSRKV